MATGAAPARSWRAAFLVYLHPRVVGMLFLGFSAGLPFLLVFTTLQFWLAESGYDPATIAFFSWIGLTYSIKFFWAPVVDRTPLPVLTRRLGRRRSWMLLAMVGIALGLCGMALTDPRTDLTAIALFALLVAFSSATQDVALDAYRIEAVERTLQGAMAATYQLGYRIAILVAGAGALYVAEFGSWAVAYLTMAACTLVGIVTVLIVREPDHVRDADAWAREERVVAFLARNAAMPARWRAISAWFIGAVVCPFVDFFTRKEALAVVILIFIGLFRISDITMGSMATKFYYDLGFTKTDVANVAKVFGLAMTIFGAFVGGTLVVRFGIMRPLVLAAVLIAATNLLFALLALAGDNIWMLTVVISADNVTGGLAGSVFIAYLSSLTSANYTATQYALFSSLMTLPGKLIGGFSGLVAEGLGVQVAADGSVLNPDAYAYFFVYVAVIGVPSVLLALYLARVSRRAAPA
ncbi:MAG: AmpG family muropeptide MFS transporter [Alphaproteobacteria bacterium]|nr:AmpG family muropeptide MFS transporter [Alphaproteobacteria bacterium]